MIIMIDNYDSFTYNLVQLIETVGEERVEVVRNDVFDVDELIGSSPKAIVVSPGPGVPANAGRIVELIRANREIPLLGVCLGHQAIGEAFGGSIVRGPVPVHGKTTEVRHSGRRLFAKCPNPFRAARYHSLVIDRASLPDDLEVDAEADGDLIMAVSHRTRAVFGVQFHPESYGTAGGERLIQNFLDVAGIATRTDR